MPRIKNPADFSTGLLNKSTKEMQARESRSDTLAPIGAGVKGVHTHPLIREIAPKAVIDAAKTKTLSPILLSAQRAPDQKAPSNQVTNRPAWIKTSITPPPEID